MDNFVYIPKARRAAGASFSFALLVVSSLCSFASLHLGYTFLFTAAACFFLVISFQVFFRYCLTEHIYTVQNGILTLERKLGKKSTVIFDLYLSLSDGVLPKKEGKRRIKDEKQKLCRRTANLLPKEKYYLFYGNDIQYAVSLEINGEFAERLNSLIKPHGV